MFERSTARSHEPSKTAFSRVLLWSLAAVLAITIFGQVYAKTYHVAPVPLAGIEADSQIRTIRDAVAHAEPGRQHGKLTCGKSFSESEE